MVFADDIFICAPPVIAAKLYAHIAYIAKKELNLVFNDEKTRFASMGNTKKLTKSLKKAFSDVQRHTTDDFPLMTIDEKSIEKFKVLPGADVLGVPVGTRDYRIAGVLRKFAKDSKGMGFSELSCLQCSNSFQRASSLSTDYFHSFDASSRA